MFLLSLDAHRMYFQKSTKPSWALHNLMSNQNCFTASKKACPLLSPCAYSQRSFTKVIVKAAPTTLFPASPLYLIFNKGKKYVLHPSFANKKYILAFWKKFLHLFMRSCSKSFFCFVCLPEPIILHFVLAACPLAFSQIFVPSGVWQCASPSQPVLGLYSVDSGSD